MRNRKQLEDSDHVVTSDPFGTFASKFVLLEFENFQILRKSSKHVSCSQAFPFSLTSFCWTQKMLKSCIAFLFKHHIRTLVTYKYNLNYVLLPVHLRCLICPHLPFMMLASVKFLFTIKRNSKYHLANSNICKQNEDKFWMHEELIRNMWPKYQLVIIP